MIYKEVTTGERFATIELGSDEVAVQFSSSAYSFAVSANGGDVNVALHSGASKGDDGVLTVTDGSSAVYPHMRSGVNTVYLTGSGTATVFASNKVINPFKKKAKGGDGSDITAIDMSNLEVCRKQSAMSYTTTATSTTSIWSGVTSIALALKYNTLIDLSQVSKIRYSLTTGTSYMGTNGGDYPIYMGLMSPSEISNLKSSTPYTSLNWTYLTTYTYSNTDYATITLDTTSLTGEAYFIFAPTGFNSTLSNIKLYG